MVEIILERRGATSKIPVFDLYYEPTPFPQSFNFPLVSVVNNPELQVQYSLFHSAVEYAVIIV